MVWILILMSHILEVPSLMITFSTNSHDILWYFLCIVSYVHATWSANKIDIWAAFFESLYANLTGSRKICDEAILQMMNLMRAICTNALTVNFYVLLIMSIMSESTYSNNLIRISQSWPALANLIGYSCFCYSLMLISSGKSLENPQCY